MHVVGEASLHITKLTSVKVAKENWHSEIQMEFVT